MKVTGEAMANLKYSELKEIFLKLTYILRGYSLLDYTNPDSEAQNLIRYAYSKNNQPFQEFEDGCSYVWINYAEAEVDKTVNYVEEYDQELGMFICDSSQLRQINVHWIFYGETAQDNAFEFRLKVYSDEAKEYLDLYGIKLIPDVPECVLLYEESNNQWWPRVEMSIGYYITTYFEEQKDPYTSVNVYLNKEDSEQIEIINEDEF